MKTEAIQLAIRSSKTGVEDRQAADDQLSAMATALAAKDEALRYCISRTRIASCDPNNAGAEDVALIEIRTACIAALTPPTGKVLKEESDA